MGHPLWNLLEYPTALQGLKEHTPQISGISVFAVILLLAGCGGDSRFSEKTPEEFNGHATLKPSPGKAYSYAFKNTAKGYTTPTWGKEVPEKDRVALVDSSLWSSTCSGRLDFFWDGYASPRNPERSSDVGGGPGQWAGPVRARIAGELLACFKYNLRDLFLQEKTADGAHVWMEEYGRNGVVVEIDGVRAANPLREKPANPIDQFVWDGNEALFHPDGRSVRMKEDLYKCQARGNSCPGLLARNVNDEPKEGCKLCGRKEWVKSKKPGDWLAETRYRIDSYSIGQYFLRGLQVEELAHRVLVMLPPVSALKDGARPATWTAPMQLWVVPAGEKAGGMSVPPPVIYEFTGELALGGLKTWHVRFQAAQRLETGTALRTGERIQGWDYSVSGEAWLEPSTLMPYRVLIRDTAVWYDVLSLAGRDSPTKYQPVMRRFENAVEYSRVPLSGLPSA